MAKRESVEKYREYFENLPKEDAILVHAVSFCVDDKGILIMAPSGVGKSTQLGLWKEILGGRVEVINDDKPELKLLPSGDVLIKSSPVCGKERDFSQKTAFLSVIYILDGQLDYEVPKIRKLDKKEAASLIIQQVYLPEDKETLDLTFELTNKIFGYIPIYLVQRNKTKECAKLCIDTLLNE